MTFLPKPEMDSTTRVVIFLVDLYITNLLGKNGQLYFYLRTLFKGRLI